MKIRPYLLLAAVTAPLALSNWTEAAQSQLSRRNQAERPTPELADAKYGPYERNVLDLWKAKSGQPTPLVVFIHGGAFKAGDKKMISPRMLKGLLTNGVSVMAINYRLSPGVHFPTHYMDCARAIQFARLHANAWNIDPKRIGATGGSAGAGTSLWIGFHDDTADPKSRDPVLRESTRLRCMVVLGAQSTYDPRVIKEWVSEPTSKHPALLDFYGLQPDELDTSKAHKLYEDASPVTHLTADDPPAFLYYNESDAPVPPDAPNGAGIHHPNFGKKLKERMDWLKIECVMRNGGDVQEEMLKFFLKYLAADKTSKPK